MERNTRQRHAIQKAIDDARRPLSPQEVLEAAQTDVPGLGIATVYRNLKSMLEAGAIELVVLPGDNPRYESKQAAAHHHHHFQCRACGKVYDVPGCVQGYAQLAPTGFAVEGHELTLYGVCADCAHTGVAARPVDEGHGHGHDHDHGHAGHRHG
ncbi:MAG: Zinc-specific metallo-regulatory protein [Paracidovorax wautersii]|uniref:Ferric uptake regulation protein n=1 Tax=Paracidovorax wautersii TaxID=1177982 RepID=A0A7V8FQV4_9BURK|nr:MAG: Zinc-specific metallo-regulatory protein [Paracidovorax wautersii]